MATHNEKDSVFFQATYQRWIDHQTKKASGDRKRRLLNGLGYAEKLFAEQVWWPSFKSFDALYPEYEVRDFKDGVRYLDLAYLKDGLRICIEIDAYGTHHRDVDRWQFSDNLTRQNDLLIDGWRLLRFSLDEIKEHTRRCQQQLQQAFGKWGLEKKPLFPADNPIDLAILQLMSGRDIPLSPTEGSRLLGWHRITISVHMRNLLDQGYLIPSKPGNQRNKSYRLNPDFQHHKK